MRNKQRGVGSRSRAKRWSLKLALILGGVLAGLLVGEIALRIVGYSYPVFYRTDQDRGVSLRPGMAGWYRKEGTAYIQINGDGLRDREHSKAKAPDTEGVR